MRNFTKKQTMVAAALVLGGGGAAGYAAFALAMPHPAGAAGAKAPVKLAAANTAATPAAPAETPPAVPQPSPHMRDPFIPGVVDQALLPPAPAPHVAKLPPMGSAKLPMDAAGSKRRWARIGPAPVLFPKVPGLPSTSLAALPQAGMGSGAPAGLAPMPAAPAAPAWNATGVVVSGADSVAILRNGDARRIVRQGELVDGRYRVVSVTHHSVILRHGGVRYTLPLAAQQVAQAAPAEKPAETAGGKPAADAAPANTPAESR